jgi:hypothetical protein
MKESWTIEVWAEPAAIERMLRRAAQYGYAHARSETDESAPLTMITPAEPANEPTHGAHRGAGADR